MSISPLAFLRSFCKNVALAMPLLLSPPWAEAAVVPFGPVFTATQMPVTDGTQYVRVGGQGPAVLLLHGFGDSGDMWQPLAAVLVKEHTVIVPDLRGMGLSSHPQGGYTKMAQARDVAALLDRLKIREVALVTHDIGNMVGYALAAQFPDRVRRWAVMDAPVPGLGNWTSQLTNPKTWHFNFRGPDVERLVAGRERILLDRFYNDLSATPARIDEATREHYAALYARPGAIHDAFSGQFGAFAQDAIDNQAIFARIGKLRMPVLGVGGDHSYGQSMQSELSTLALDVSGAVVTESGHWIMEEQPLQALKILLPFIDGVASTALQKRLTPEEIGSLARQSGGAGTSGVSGIATTVLYGDPAQPGLYTIELRVPPHTNIQADTHRDTRTATVVSGTWLFGYGNANDASAAKPMPPGSFYTEPGAVAHFARTGASGAVILITGVGPSDTVYVECPAPVATSGMASTDKPE